MSAAPVLGLAANGHLTRACGDLPDTVWHALVGVLENQLGCRREGRPVAALNEMIQRDFVLGDVVLSAGWDTWSGHYLLASCARGDRCLRRLHERMRLPPVA